MEVPVPQGGRIMKEGGDDTVVPGPPHREGHAFFKASFQRVRPSPLGERRKREITVEIGPEEKKTLHLYAIFLKSLGIDA